MDTMNGCIRMACLFPFKKSGGRVSVHKRILVIDFCFMVFICIFFVVTYFNPLGESSVTPSNFFDDMSTMTAFIYYVVIIACHLFCGCWFSDVFFKRGHLEQFYSLMDSTARRLGPIRFKFTTGMKGIFISMFSTTVGGFASVYFGINVATLAWIGFLYIICATIFCHVCHVAIAERYFDVISSFLDDTPENLVRGKFVRDLVNVYDQLCSAIEHLNGYYGFQLLVIIAYSFVAITGNTFFITLMFSRGDEYYVYMCMAITIVYCAALALFLFALFRACGSVILKAENFNSLLAKCALQDTTEWLLTNPHVSMHFLTRKKLEFNICGCVNLDSRLFCSIVAACISYLVILVQISQNKNVVEP